MELIKYKYVVSGKPFLDAKKKKHIFLMEYQSAKDVLIRLTVLGICVLDPDPLKYADPRIRDPRGKKSFALKT